MVNHSVGISVTGGNTVTVNGILWHNTPVTVSQATTATVSIQNQYEGDPALDIDGYHLTAGSAAIDKGVDAGVLIDIDDQVRGTIPDLGVDEYVLEGTQTTVDETMGGSLVYTDTHGSSTVLQVPIGAVTDTTTLVYTSVATATAPANFAFAGRAFDLAAYRNGELLDTVSFSPAATITVHYTDTDVVGLDEEQLYLYTWNTNSSIWEDAACGDYDRHPETNWLSVPICHLSQFALFGTQGEQLSATITKSVSPDGQVLYGDELTYTLVISGIPGMEVSLYDPLTSTTFVHFTEQPTGVEYANHAITGTLTITPINQITISFVVEVGVPGTIGIYVDVSNKACVYPVGQTSNKCEWSNTVVNQVYRPYTIFLPLVVRN